MSSRGRQYLVLAGTLVLVAALLPTETAWRGTIQMHTLIESIATTIAFMVGVSALIRHYSSPSMPFLFLGAAFIGTAALDAYHTVLTASAHAVPLSPFAASVLPWSWLGSRIFLSIMLCLSWAAWRREAALGPGGRIRDRTVYGAVLTMTLLSALVFALVPIPPAYRPTWFLSRPHELIPGVFFGLATWAYVAKMDWRQSTYEHWLILSLIIDTVGQLLYMSRSHELHDLLFGMSHFLKVASYSCVLVGLFGNTFVLFKQLEIRTARVERSAEQLRLAYSQAKATARTQLAVLAETHSKLEQTLADHHSIAERLEHHTNTQVALTVLGGDLLTERQVTTLLHKAIAAVAHTLRLSEEQVRPVLSFHLAQQLHRSTKLPVPIGLDPILMPLATFIQTHSTPPLAASLPPAETRFVQIVAHLLCAAIERIRTEGELQASLERFELAVQATHDGIWDTRMNAQHRLDANTPMYYAPRFLYLLGYDPGEFPPVFGSWLGCVHPQDQETFLDAFERHLHTRTSCDLEYRMVTKNGDIRWFSTHGQARWDEHGRPVRMAGSLQDITERRSLQSQLLQAQKMEALGRLAGSIAHDFNNLLTIIRGYTDMILSQAMSPAHIPTQIEEIRKAAGRATALTSRLLTFSRRDAFEPKVMNINQLLRQAEGLLRRLTGDGLIFTMHLYPSLSSVKVDPVSLEQVLINLVGNARDAMREGGYLTIETRPALLRQEDPSTSTTEPGVAIIVRDTGHGMDAETQNRIFEPFFTTKPAGKGTGLGLSIVYSIIEQHHGSIRVDSAPGQGTVFTITLPASPESAPVEDNPVPTVAAHFGHETILLVEDDPDVRRLTRTILETHGYHVLEAGSGPDALHFAQHYDRPIDLLLTDTIMPGMTGHTVAQRLLAVRPALRVLYMSGHDQEAMSSVPPDIQATLLRKPFAPGVLAERVRNILDQEVPISGLPAVIDPPVGPIVILDDDEQLAPMLASMLRAVGHSVHVTHQGTTALHLVAQHPVSVLLTDMQMPEEDGLTIIQRLKRSNPNLKIIAMSGGGRLSARIYLDLAKQAGADTTLIKPFSQDELLSAIQTVVTSSL